MNKKCHIVVLYNIFIFRHYEDISEIKQQEDIIAHGYGAANETKAVYDIY